MFLIPRIQTFDFDNPSIPGYHTFHFLLKFNVLTDKMGSSQILTKYTSHSSIRLTCEILHQFVMKVELIEIHLMQDGIFIFSFDSM